MIASQKRANELSTVPAEYRENATEKGMPGPIPPLNARLECIGPYPPIPPPPDGISLLEHQETGGRLSLIRFPGERLRLLVWDAAEQLVCCYETQPFRVDGPGDVALSVYIIANHAHIILNGTELAPRTPDESLAVFDASAEDLPLIASFSHPSSVAACNQRMTDRRLKFASAPRLRNKRRFKSIEEQARDLRNATCNLHHLHDAIMSGKVHLIGHLATELRALIHWERDTQRDSQYNPILLRLADAGGLPLALFAEPDAGPLQPQAGMLSRVVANIPRVYQTRSTQVLMDLQDWLLTTAVIQLDPHTLQETRFTNREMISETANVLGPAHYDEDISTGVDVLRSTVSSELDFHVRFLGEVAEFVKAQSEWVLEQLARQGKIA